MLVAVQRQRVAGPQAERLHSQGEGTPDIALCGAVQIGARERAQEEKEENILGLVYRAFFTGFLFVDLFLHLFVCLCIYVHVSSMIYYQCITLVLLFYGST